MGRHSPIAAELKLHVMQSPSGITVKELAELLADKAGEWAVGHQASRLAQRGEIVRKWEYYDAGLKGPIGRWRYFPA